MATATVTELHGKYYKQASLGRIFTASTAATGIALIVPATTGNHPTLWNPSDSQRNVSIIKLELGYISGNNAPSTLEWAITTGTGAAVATAAPILTFTQANAVGIVGGSLDNKARWAPAVNTFTAAPVFYRTTGLSLFTGVAATAVAPFSMVATYDGDLVLAPGTALSLCTQQATTTALFQVSITWEEANASGA